MRRLKSVKTKMDFQEAISDMESPVIKEFYGNSDYLNLSFYVYDEKDMRNKFPTNSVIYNPKTETIQQYSTRESEFRKKINKWFNECVNS